MEAIPHFHGNVLPYGDCRILLLSGEQIPLRQRIGSRQLILCSQESAGKSLEEMDFLFGKDRNVWVFLDREATKIGAIFERDMAHGEALTVFDDHAKIAVNRVDGSVERYSMAPASDEKVWIVS